MNKYPLMKEQTFFQRHFSPAGTISAGAFWTELGIKAISCLCASILLCILIVVLVPGTSDELTKLSELAVMLLAALWLIPVAVLTRRRLRDGGYTAKAYLWLLLPVVGWIIFVLLLCRKGSEDPVEEEHISY